MLFQSDPKLEEIIVVLLAGKAALDAEEIELACRKLGKPFTRQAIYKELAKLQRQGIALKVGRQFTLKFDWVMRMQHLSEKMHETQLRFNLASTILPLPGEMKTWHFSDLFRLDDFWAHLLLVLLRGSQSKHLFERVAQPWFELIHAKKELNFKNALRMLKKRVYVSMDASPYLGAALTDNWPGDIYEYSFAEGPFTGNSRYIYDVIDQYVLRIDLGATLPKVIDHLFREIRRSEDINIGTIVQSLRTKSRLTVKLENNIQHAARRIKDFRRFFGIK